MKLVVLYLLAVCCYAFASTSTDDKDQQKRILMEVLRNLKTFEKVHQSSNLMIRTPQDYADCCSLTAFRCFRDNLAGKFSEHLKDVIGKKLRRGLFREEIETAMNFCESGTTAPTCTDCLSYPEQTAAEFLEKMKSLFQHARSRQVQTGPLN